MKVLGISGSLRRDSHNTKLLRAAEELLPAFVDFEVWDELKAVPPFDEDDELGPEPAAVASLRQAVGEADAILFGTPEYNASVPGQLKNAIDWLSRPSSDIAKVFGDRPVGVIGASPGGFGTILAQNGWLPVLRTLGTRMWFGGRVTPLIAAFHALLFWFSLVVFCPILLWAFFDPRKRCLHDILAGVVVFNRR